MIESYLAGPDLLRAAVAGLDDRALDALPGDGSWTIRQIVAHLLDSDLIASHRMKRVLAESNPLLIGYDETAFAQSLFYENEPTGELLDLFALNRAQTGRILQRAAPESWSRRGVHNERGTVTLGGLVADYVQHLEHHLHFVRAKRARLTSG